MRLIAKVDANQALIVDALRRIGCSVHCTHRVGDGFPDVVIGYQGVTHIGEIKVPGGKLSESQETFHAAWRGSPVLILVSPEQAIELVTSPPERQGEWWYS